MAPAKSRKRQTRLALSPLPSSSAGAAALSASVRDRAAAVAYVGAKRRRVDIENVLYENDKQSGTVEDSGLGLDGALPTPVKSSQVIKKDKAILDDSDDSSDSDIVLPQRSASKPSRPSTSKSKSLAQARLDFSQHIGRAKSPQSSDATAPKQRTNNMKFGKSRSSAIALSSDSSSSSSSEDERPAVKLISSSTKRQLRSNRIDQNDDQTDVRSSPEAAPRRSTRGSARKPAVIVSSDEENDAKDGDFTKPIELDIGEPESSGDEIIVSSPLRKPRVKAINTSAKRTRPRITDDFIDDDSDELPTIDEIVRRQTSSDEEEDKISAPHRRARARTPQNAEDSEDASEDEEDEAPVSTKRRRLVNSEQSESKQLSKREQEDLAEDLEFLSSPSKDNSATRLRSSLGTPKQSARSKALELLKRRRAGERADDVGTEEPETRPRRGLYDTESDQHDEIEDNEDSDDLADAEHIGGPAPVLNSAATHDMFLEDEYDQDFIAEDDENDTIGVPQLPVQFSSVSRMKSKDLFKYAVEWMVQKKINPAFAIDDEVYDLTFRKLDDEVKGLAGSKFTSSAWTERFTRALHARPSMNASELAGISRSLLEHHCDACNRTNHPATYDIQFFGKPYKESTLEDVSDDDSDEVEEDHDTQEYDSKGRPIVSEDVIFHVGRVCMQNAHWAHTLAHWRYHLNDWVLDYLAQEGYTTPEKIVERDSWKTKKRRKYAEKVVDKMAETGEIKRLYNDFRTEVNTARDTKTDNRWRR